MNINKIQEVCEFVRMKLEAIPTSKMAFPPLYSLNDFPRGSCKTTSFILMSILSSKYKVPKNQLFLITFESFEDEEISHAWVKYNELHIDITGDQFEKDRIVISSDSPWPGKEFQKHPFEEENWNEEYTGAINRVLQYLDS